jgi:hypothetical protein
MPLYPAQSLQMLANLINSANPTLPVALTPTNVKYGTPTAVTPPNGQIQDTSIKVTALASGQYIGNTTLTYRRVNFANLFRAIPIRIDLYSPAGTSISPYMISQLLAAINAKYGLNLTAADIVDAALPAGNTNAVPAIGLPAGTRNSSITVNASTTSYGWEGSFTLYWVQAPQNIASMITTPSLENARVYPGGLGTVSPSIYVVDLDTYSYDFTAVLGTGGTINPAAIASGTIPVTSTGNFFSLVQAINAAAASGNAYTCSGNGTQLRDLVGSTTSAVLDMTQAANQQAYPEADYRYFNRLLVITLSANAAGWGAGKLFLHYNV